MGSQPKRCWFWRHVWAISYPDIVETGEYGGITYSVFRKTCIHCGKVRDYGRGWA